MPRKPTSTKPPVRKSRASRDEPIRKGRVRAADPFDLIRFLARSQPDPRKALAELVQNSLDAGARNIRITRQRKGGVPELRVHDDGEGVIPELSREEALTYLATHIGHSRKRELTPEQRRRLLLQGKYGIGLLGFWSIGRTMEIRSQVPGEPALFLELHEDSAEWRIDRVRGRLALGEERFTEIVIRDLHRQAMASLSARRIADFLGSELRGQLVGHQARVVVHDGIARGLATKFVEVQPLLFEGERIELPESIEIPGRSPLHVELYLLPGGAEGGKVTVSQAGTIVYEDIAEFAIADFARAPWTNERLTGVLDFADFEVPPGTRRAVVPDEAAAAFVAAVRDLEPLVATQVDSADSRSGAEVEASVLRQLERAFREVPRHAPEYDFFEVLDARRRGFAGGPAREEEEEVPDEAATPGDPESQATEAALPEGIVLPQPKEEPPAEEDPAIDDDDGLLPMAGPLARANVSPALTRVEPLGRRRLRVTATDESGFRIRRPLDIRWTIEGEGPPLATIEADGATAVLVAGANAGTVTVRATVGEAERTSHDEAVVEIVAIEAAEQAPRSGIPEPVFLDEPASAWRSRMIDHRWEVNSGHPDFVQAAETMRRKTRYLAALLAKEVVLHSFPAPQLAEPLERMVEVLSIIEKRLERG